MKKIRPKLLAAACLALLGACGAALAAPAGKVEYVAGAVQAIGAGGQVRILAKGDAVDEGDTLVTGADAAAQVRMEDGGLVALRSDTRMKLDSFRFDGKQDGTEQYIVSLFKGGFRAITGLIGRLHKESYRITTPTATIGIRGTDHETIVVVPGSRLAATVPPGTYNKVNRGETAVSNEHGTVLVLPNQMAYAAAGAAPVLQPLNLDIFVVPPPPAARAGRTDTEMRDSAIVDSALLDPDLALGPNLPIGIIFSRTPITATYTTLVPVGGAFTNQFFVPVTTTVTF
ncbi:MAG TPA: FecR domain-containing protein [Gallionellaceae bacterium]|nr:FecR domain-containing protein [Gallionellaceae bacterium]